MEGCVNQNPDTGEVRIMKWETIVREIMWEARWSQNRLARELGITQAHVWRIKEGLQTKVMWGLGQKILRLHEQWVPGSPVKNLVTVDESMEEKKEPTE